MSLRYKVVSRIIRFRKKFSPKVVLNDRETMAIEVVNAAIHNPDVDLFMAPITGHKYIQDEKNHLSIILTGENIVIVNHKYYYDINLGLSAVKILSRKFDKVLESRRRKYEKDIKENTLRSLRSIATALRQRD